MKPRIAIACCGALFLAMGAIAPAALAQTSARPTLQGPITGGSRGAPFGARAAALPSNYVEEEWFLSGTATAFQKASEWGRDGRWEIAPDETEPYMIRALVRRPAVASDFNGIVIVEWLNVSALQEGDADYSQMEEEILREGYAWIGVGAQAVGIHAPGVGLEAWDPARYEPLGHPGDRLSYDIFSQVARAVREAPASGGLLGGLEVERLIAAGRSQSAFRLVTYVNAFHPREPLFDGFFIHSRGRSAAGLRAESLAPDPSDPVPAGAWIREDVGVPVLDLQTEGDMVTLGSLTTRQPANATYRRWEIAGAAHAEVPRWVVEVPPELSRGPGCARPVNAAPHHAFVKAGLRALAVWVTTGVVPPQSPEVQVGASAADPIARDEHGNALGGIRIPGLEAPTATLDGRVNTVATGGGGGQNFCFLYGNTVPFDDGTLRALYPTHEAFVARFTAAVDRLEREGYLLAPEAADARRAAMESGIGR